MTRERGIRAAHRLCAVFTAVSAALLFILFTAFFDAEAGYFNDGTNALIVKILFGTSCFVCFASSLVPACLFSEDTASACAPGTSFFRLPTLRKTVGALALLLGGTYSILGELGLFELPSQAFIFCGIGLFSLGALALLSDLAPGAKKTAITLVLLLFACALPLGLRIADSENYFRHVNSVENRLDMVFSIFLLVYILYEGNRAFRGAPTRLYFSSVMLVLSNGLTLSSAYIAAYLFGAVHERERFLRMLAVLAACLTVLALALTDKRQAES